MGAPMSGLSVRPEGRQARSITAAIPRGTSGISPRGSLGRPWIPSAYIARLGPRNHVIDVQPVRLE